MVIYYTSVDSMHRHKYDPKRKRTTFDNGHDHPIDLRRRIAKKGLSDHTHILLKVKA